MKRKDILNDKKTFLKRLTAAVMLFAFLACAGCANAASAAGSADEAASSARESAPAVRETSSPPKASSEAKETPSPEPSSDPYSYEELTKDIPPDFWDQFLPEIENVYYNQGDGWDYSDEDWGFVYYKDYYLLRGNSEYLNSIAEPDYLYEALSAGKSRIYEDMFEEQLPLNSPIGYYLLGLKQGSDIIKLYSITQLSKYIGTVYEDAAISALDEVIEEYEKIAEPNQTEEIILLSAKKFKAFLEYDFYYTPEDNDIYGFSEGYIWAPENQPNTPLPVVAWIPQMGTLVDARRIGSKMWVSNGYEIWEIIAYPASEYTKFNSNGSEFTFLDWDKIIVTVSVEDNWNDNMAHYANVISSTSTTGDYAEPYASLAEDYYRLIYRPDEDEISENNTVKIAEKEQAYNEPEMLKKAYDTVNSADFIEEAAYPLASFLAMENSMGYDPSYSKYEMGERFYAGFLWGALWSAPTKARLNLSPIGESVYNDDLYPWGNFGDFAIYGYARPPLEELIYDVFGDKFAVDINLDELFIDDLYYYSDAEIGIDVVLYEPSVNREGKNYRAVYPAKFLYEEGVSEQEFYLTLELTLNEDSKFGYVVTAASWSDTPPSGAAASQTSNSSNAASSSASFDENGFVFADSSSRYLTEEELSSLSKETLGYARNEIFARHGNVFETPKYINHFSQYDWYNNLPKVQDVGYPDLNDVEIANVELIKQFEDD